MENKRMFYCILRDISFTISKVGLYLLVCWWDCGDQLIVTNSLTLDHDCINDEELKLGSKAQVKVPLKVYHVPRVPALELMGKLLNLFDGKQVKFTAHLREDEFEFLE
ncbi:Ferredoxin:thioredoxin reductase [Handroanthus impetiginosus]|uniref:Ferredoxin:thioredoxin reductase n=1 Tax=Handroanthus impetiginosus TaxID=429701 RepID=A0A2G9G0X6_9LAMI|nr:Ferredoxin:thioredoxin reductase [Handroanthus impetiginosus]